MVIATLAVLSGSALAGAASAPTPPTATATAPAPSGAPGWGPTFHTLTPTRVLDTRTPLGGFGGPLAAGAPKDLALVGVAGIGASATAVVLNVTATGASAPSFLTLYPSLGARPTASNVNFAAGETTANAATVQVGTNGAVRFANEQGAVHVIADVVGWFDDGSAPGTLYNAVGPTRVLDSRGPVGGWDHPLAAGDANVRTLALAGGHGIPRTATSVVLNVTATNATAGSFVQVWPTGTARPTSSSLNFGAFQTVANLVSTPLGPDGSISFYDEVGNTDLVVDVTGYFDPTQGANFHVLAPTRVLDDRNGTGLSGPWAPGQSRTFTVAGTHGIPADATGVIANLTATNATAGTWLAVSPLPSPTTSSLNVGAGETRANLGADRLAGGALQITNDLGQVDLVLDVAGWFDGDTKARPIYYGGTTNGVGTNWYQAGVPTPFYAPGHSTDLPVPGDYDGDGRWDVASVDPSGTWTTLGTAGTIQFAPPQALPGDTGSAHPVDPVPGHYRAGSPTLPAWYREADATWFVQGQDPIQFGQGPTDPTVPATVGLPIARIDQDLPVPADYDGDDITDLATYRPGTARWMIRRSSDLTTVTATLGDPMNLTFPVPADYAGSGHAQIATYDGSHTPWRFLGPPPTTSSFGDQDWGWPWAADYDGVGHAQLAYISDPTVFSGTAQPAHWHVEGNATTTDAVGTAFPVGFPIAFAINVARLTLIQRCLSGSYPC